MKGTNLPTYTTTSKDLVSLKKNITIIQMQCLKRKKNYSQKKIAWPWCKTKYLVPIHNICFTHAYIEMSQNYFKYKNAFLYTLLYIYSSDVPPFSVTLRRNFRIFLLDLFCIVCLSLSNQSTKPLSPFI